MFITDFDLLPAYSVPITPPIEENIVFDANASEALFQPRNASDTDNVTQFIAGQSYIIRAGWVFSDGTYAGVPDDGLIRMSVSHGTVTFLDRVESTNINRYTYTAASNTTDQQVTWVWGRFDDETQATSTTATQQVLTVGVPDADETVSQSIVLPNNTVAENSINSTTWNTWIQGEGGRVYDAHSNQLSVVSNNSNYWLQAKHAANGTGSARITLATSIPNRVKYRTRFKFKLLSGFDFGGSTVDVQSGKLGLGLAGGQDGNGQIVSGGTVHSGGWSARFIWRGNTIKVYTYNWNRSTRTATSGSSTLQYGDEYPLPAYPVSANGAVIQADVEYEAMMEVGLNSSGQSNGTLKAWLNDEQFIDATGIQWMLGTPEIDRVILNSFHGGGSSAWDPNPSPAYILYRDMEILHG